MKIGYLVHDLNDPSVERRCIMLERGGADVTLAGFTRGKSRLSGASNQRAPLILGVSHDDAMIQRAASTVSNALFSRRLRRHFVDCDVLIARNLEQLAIVCPIIRDRRLIYECLDIHRLLTSQSLPGRLLQFLERRLLARSNLLLTSSPGFVREHFEEILGETPFRIVENKMLMQTFPDERAIQIEASLPVRIGWFGMLRCRRSLDVLKRVAEKGGKQIEIDIRGKPSPAQLPDLTSDAASEAHLNFYGPYAYDDLPKLYTQYHFAWAVDWYEAGQNSAWLLPNRLYEALAHGVIPIVLDGTELARWTKRYGVGLLVKGEEDAAKKLLSLDVSQIAAMQRAVTNIPMRDVIADDDDCLSLVDVVSGKAAA